MKKKCLSLMLTLLLMVFLPKTVLADDNIPLYRLYNPGLRVHLYTKDKNEYSVLGKRGWNQEGLAWVTANGEGDTVFRLYHPDLKVHLYTKDQNEYKVLALRGWRQEGTAFYSEGKLPIYRLYHSDMKKHLYTKDSNEYKVLATRGWKQEGIAFYGLTSAAQKITTENLKTNEVLPFKKITKDDKNLFKDESKIQTKGVNGSLERTYKVTYIDGIESKRVKIKETRKEPIDEVTLKGTKDRITTKTETVRSELDFRTTYESDYSMLQGENKIKIKGEKGYTETVYEIIYTNGVETSRKIIKENHQEPVNEVLLVGMSSLNEYTVSILSYDPEYQPIGRDYIEAPDLPYGETQLKEEGRPGYYTIVEKIGQGKPEIISKVKTPTKNDIYLRGTKLEEGDVPLRLTEPNRWNPSIHTVFGYLNLFSTDEELYLSAMSRISYGSEYDNSVDWSKYSSDEIEKIKATIDVDLINKYFLEKINIDRKNAGLPLMNSTPYGRELANIRAQEQADYGEVSGANGVSTRPDGSDWKTVDSLGLARYEYIDDVTWSDLRKMLSERYIAEAFYDRNFDGYNIHGISSISFGIGLAKGRQIYSVDSGKLVPIREDSVTMIIVAIAE